MLLSAFAGVDEVAHAPGDSAAVARVFESIGREGAGGDGR